MSRLSPADAHRTASRIAVVAALFCAAVLFALWRQQQLSQPAQLANAAELRQLRDQVKAEPRNAELKSKLRREDLRLRSEFFRRKAILGRGALLLIGGLVVMLAAAHVARHQSRPAHPTPLPGVEDRQKLSWSRWSVVTVGIILCAAAAGVVQEQSQLPVVVSSPPPTAAQVALDQWPGFRGPLANGIAQSPLPPSRWDIASGENIRWRVKVPSAGHSSPIVWNDRVFVSGADPDWRQVYCFDRLSGTLLWTAEIDGQSASEGQQPLADTGFAAPTLTTDGERVFAMFADGQVLAVSMTGEELWLRQLGWPDNPYGHAASPLCVGQVLIIQFDQGTAGARKSRLLGLSAATGTTVWEVQRQTPATWSTPVAASSPDAVIACGDPWVIAYDPHSGRELWRADCLAAEIAPSPVVAGGTVYVAAPGGAAAIALGGRGDITASHLRWRLSDELPDICSPLVVGEHLYLTAYGQISCYRTDTGAVVWQHDFETMFWASPVAVEDRIYCAARDGTIDVVAAGAEFKLLAQHELGEACNASPAIVGGELFIRGEEHLVCIAADSQP